MLGHKDILGLDAGSDAIRIVRFHRAGFSMRIADTAVLERSGDAETCARNLRAILHEKGWSYLPCVFGMRSDLISTRILEISDNSDAGFRRLASSHIEEFEILAGAPTVTEYAITRSSGQQRLLLVTARVDTILRELQLPREAGLRVTDIIPAPVALHAGLDRLLPRSRKPTACIKIEKESTEWIVGHGHDLLHLRSIPIGRRILHEEQKASGTDNPVTGRPMFMQWLNDLHAALRAYRIQYDSAIYQPGRLVLAGDCNLGSEDHSLISEKLDLPVAKPHDRYLERPEPFATAIGLALAGAGKKPIRISLLPPAMKSSEEERRQIMNWTAACAALLLASSIFAVNTWRELNWNQRLLAEYEQTADKLDTFDKELTEYKEINRRLRRQVIPMRAAVRNNHAAKAILNAVAEARDPNDWFVLIADAESYFLSANENTRGDSRRGSPSRTDFDGVKAFRQIIVEGYTPVDDLSTVRAMIEKLRDYPFIADADLLPDDKISNEANQYSDLLAGNARRFALEIELATRSP